MFGISFAERRNQCARGQHLPHRHGMDPDGRRTVRVERGRQPTPPFRQRAYVLPVTRRLIQQSRSERHGVADDGQTVEEIHQWTVVRVYGTRRFDRDQPASIE